MSYHQCNTPSKKYVGQEFNCICGLRYVVFPKWKIFMIWKEMGRWRS